VTTCRASGLARPPRDVVDLLDPVPGDGQRLHDVTAAGADDADSHHRL
jgi:hypothetical protein